MSNVSERHQQTQAEQCLQFESQEPVNVDHTRVQVVGGILRLADWISMQVNHVATCSEPQCAHIYIHLIA